MTTKNTVILGVCLILAGGLLGRSLGRGAIQVKAMDRTVVVKGLAEREVPADVVIWPVAFSAADNDLSALYSKLESQSQEVEAVLAAAGIAAADITRDAAQVVDKAAQQWGNDKAQFRYTGTQTVTIYSHEVAKVRSARRAVADLGKTGFVFSADEYNYAAEYLFTGLNEIKPDMVADATRNAREVAEKFATDSQSSLGKIRKARQGQFSISNRDKNNPHIKKVRVVSTVEYYLSD